MPRSCGRNATLGVSVLSASAGSAASTRNEPATITETAGRASTRSTIAPQKRLSPSRDFVIRPIKGTRPRSTRSPSTDRMAGRPVSDPIRATRTTIMAEMPSVMKVGSPASSMPDMAMNTVMPEIRTACPDVDAATSRARSRLVREVAFAAFSSAWAACTATSSPAFLAALTAAFACLIAARSYGFVAARSSRSRRR